MKSTSSIFKFSQITRQDWSVGAALFTLQNMGALERKLRRGEDDVILKLIEEIVAAYLIEKGVEPPQADYTPPVEQPST
jgi:hypothetical protein